MAKTASRGTLWNQKSHGKRHGNSRFVPGLILLMTLAGCSWGSGEAPPPATATMVSATVSAPAIPLCEVHWARTCVVDGDTIWLDGTKIRLEDIDAPETHRGGYRCAAEKALGDRATLRLQALLSAAPFEVRQAGARAHDRYGRELRTLFIGGRSVGQELVAEGLAHEWVGHKLPWC